MTNPVTRNPATSSSKPAGDETKAAPAPAAPAPAAASVAPATGPTKPKKEEESPFSLHQIQNAVVQLLIDTAAQEHTTKTDLSYGKMTGSVLLGESVAFQGSKTYRGLVAGDVRRNQHATDHPDQLWVKTRAMVGMAANFPLAGASLGFNGSVEVASIAAQPKKKYVDAVVGQAKSMVLPVTAQGLVDMKAAPGSEWSIRGQAGATLGYGTSVGSGDDPDTHSANAGTGVNVGYQLIYTKNVKTLGDNRVFFLIGKHDIPSASASLGANVKLVEMASSDNEWLEKGNEQIEKSAKLTASISASIAWPHRQLGGAVLDLNKPNDRAHYDHLMRAAPLDAEEYIKTHNLGATYEGNGRTISTGFSLAFGAGKLLSSTTVYSNEHGTFNQKGVKSQLAEASYTRLVEGSLARLALGEERTVMVRAGALTREGKSQPGVMVQLNVSDGEMTSRELGEHLRFAALMGSSIKGLPDPKSEENFGRGNMSVLVSVTTAQLEVLAKKSPADVRHAFALAQRDIDGHKMLPPWYTNHEKFTEYKNRLNTSGREVSAANPETTDNVLDYYKFEFEGRDLKKDIESAEAVELVLEQAADCRGKNVDDWGKVLEAVGMQATTDVRAGLLALNRLSGAQAVQLSMHVKKQRVTSSAGAALPSIADLVGTLSLPI